MSVVMTIGDFFMSNKRGFELICKLQATVLAPPLRSYALPTFLLT